jgi:hypothetical protein
MALQDPYATLGVSPSASAEEIHSAYLRIVRVLHPDRFDREKQAVEWRQANDMLRAANEAYGEIKARRSSGDRPRTGEPSQGTGARSAPPPETPPAEMPRRGHARFQELTKGVRDRLTERQADRVREQAWAATSNVVGQYVLAALLLIWFFILASLAQDPRWSGEEVAWILPLTAAMGLGYGYSLDRIVRWHRAMFKCRLYVTPIHIVAIDPDGLRWWPLWEIKDLKATHQYRNGIYTGTTLALTFPDQAAHFTLTQLAGAERWLATLRLYDQTCRKAATNGAWNYFVANDDFRGFAGSAQQARRDRLHLRSLGLGIAGSLVVFAIAYGYNANQSSWTGPPPTPPPRAVKTEEMNPPEASLTTFSGADQSTSVLSTAGEATFLAPEQELPKNGHVVRYRTGKALAPLEILTPASGGHHLVKLVDWNSGKEVMAVFIRSGEKIHVKVPLGSYHIRDATGSKWYGIALLFGPETSYAELDAQFDFEREGEQVRGHSIELIMQTGGNLKQKKIRPEDW